MRLAWTVLAGAAALSAAPALAADGAPTLNAPALVTAGSGPISVDVGHAAPFLADIDGDGKAELLVGQFEDGKLRVYPNRGSAKEPRFDSHTWFQAGGTTGKVPAG